MSEQSRLVRRFLHPAGVVAGLVVLAVLGFGGTSAYLSSAATVSGSTVDAGSLGLTINGHRTATLGTWNPAPNTPRARHVVVTNTGDVRAALSAQVNATSTDAIRNNTRLRLISMPNASGCTATTTGGVHGGILAFPSTSVTTLDAGASTTICAIVTLDPNTSIAHSGESVAFDLTFTATQEAS